MPTCNDHDVSREKFNDILDAIQDDGLIKDAVFTRGGK